MSTFKSGTESALTGYFIQCLNEFYVSGTDDKKQTVQIFTSGDYAKFSSMILPYDETTGKAVPCDLIGIAGYYSGLWQVSIIQTPPKGIVVPSTGDKPGPAPQPTSGYTMDFKTTGSKGDWTINEKSKDAGLTADVWTFDAKYGMKATAYANSTNYASEVWLVSPKIDLSKMTKATLSIHHAVNFFTDIDTSKKEYKRKKECFNGVDGLTLITPSKWLKDLVSLSYLNSYPAVVINNGIDLNIFKTNIDLSIRNKYSIRTDKKIILGVSSIWNKMKGLDDFIKLSKDIQDNMLIVLVGLTEKQIKSMPNNIIGIKRTDNQEDLVKLYSLADVFVNPTLEDTYPTVNIEAIACGTPVVTYDTGGCKEQISEKTGFVCENYEDLVKKINYCIKKDFKNNSFSNKEVIQKFDSSFCYKKYIDLYDGCDEK